MRWPAVLLACSSLVACGTGSADPTAAATLSPTPAPTSAAADYLKPLTGFRYAPLDTKSGVDFRSRLEGSTALGHSVRGYALRTITYNGDSYGVTVEVFDLDPLVAGRDGIQDELVSAATGRADLREVGLGARPVVYFNVSNFTSYLWLHGTSFVIVSAEPVSAGKAAQIAEVLIEANTTESTYIITGQVLSALNGNPVPDVTIWVTLAGHECCANVVPGVLSGATGRYQLRVPEGDYRILFYPVGIDGFGATWYPHASDYESGETIHVAKNTGSLDGVLPAGHKVSGHITTNGQPVRGAHVDVFSASGGFVTGFDANDDGAWLLRLASGKYRLLFWPPDDTTAPTRWWRSGDSIQNSEVLIVDNSDVKNVDVSLAGGAL